MSTFRIMQFPMAKLTRYFGAIIKSHKQQAEVLVRYWYWSESPRICLQIETHHHIRFIIKALKKTFPLKYEEHYYYPRELKLSAGCLLSVTLCQMPNLSDASQGWNSISGIPWQQMELMMWFIRVEDLFSLKLMSNTVRGEKRSVMAFKFAQCHVQ